MATELKLRFYGSDLVSLPASELRPGDLWYRSSESLQAWALVQSVEFYGNLTNHDVRVVHLYYLGTGEVDIHIISGISGDKLIRNGEVIFDSQKELARHRETAKTKVSEGTERRNGPKRKSR